MTEKCGAIGALTVGGRVVGQLKCELEAGHDQPRYSARQPSGAGLITPYEVDPPEPHAVTLTWTPETEPDLDLFDPAESFDVEVPEPPARSIFRDALGPRRAPMYGSSDDDGI